MTTQDPHPHPEPVTPSGVAPARPLGVTILAILAAIAGVLGLLGSLLILAAGGIVGAAGGGALGGLFGIIGILTLILAIAYLAFAFGAWTLKPWAWMLGLVAGGVGIALGVLQLFGGDMIGPLISIVINGAIIYYLMTPEVKTAFGRA